MAYKRGVIYLSDGKQASAGSHSQTQAAFAVRGDRPAHSSATPTTRKHDLDVKLLVCTAGPALGIGNAPNRYRFSVPKPPQGGHDTNKGLTAVGEEGVVTKR